MSERLIRLADVKILLIFTYFAYLYCRKKRRAFGLAALCGYAGTLVGLIMQLKEGLKTIVMAASLFIAIVLSYNELDSLEKEGVDAKNFLDLTPLDIAVLVLFLMIWTFARTYY